MKQPTPTYEYGGQPESSQPEPLPAEKKPDHPLTHKTIDERYNLKHSLGEGGMGTVFKAFDNELQKNVALKLISHDLPRHQQEVLHKRLKREIKILMLVEDPRVVSLLDWGLDKEHGLYYTMEYLEENLPLEDYFNQSLPFAVWLDALDDILGGLGALHELGVLHRDLKPSNILCTWKQDRLGIKLIDPGIARWISQEARANLTVQTAPNAVLGTPHYMPPEMWQGQTISTTSDIYQIGILTYEMFAGYRPFEDDSLHTLIFKHLMEPLPPLLPVLQQRFPSVSLPILEGLEACVKHATEKNPQERIQKVDEFREALYILRSQLGTQGKEAFVDTSSLHNAPNPVSLRSLPTPQPSENSIPSDIRAHQNGKHNIQKTQVYSRVGTYRIYLLVMTLLFGIGGLTYAIISSTNPTRSMKVRAEKQTKPPPLRRIEHRFKESSKQAVPDQAQQQSQAQHLNDTPPLQPEKSKLSKKAKSNQHKKLGRSKRRTSRAHPVQPKGKPRRRSKPSRTKPFQRPPSAWDVMP